MDPETAYRIMLWGLFALAGVTFVAVGREPAPYGRHFRPGFGPAIPVRLAWFAMAAPGLVVLPIVFADGPRSVGFVPHVLCTLWMVHYAWRALVYPLLLRGTQGKGVPLGIVLLGMTVCAALAYVNGTALGSHGYTLRWLWSIRFLYGLLLFVTGFVLTRWVEVTLCRLRNRGETGHVLPRGGIFEEIACPNYLGETVMWLGWAVLTWSQAGLAAAVLTAANLIPRAASHHLWYRRTFRDYPPSRKAILPLFL
jgi:protein-S-isoprenylcysteine O-methyltransferase Ste14